jgi:hypothetical protein
VQETFHIASPATQQAEISVTASPALNREELSGRRRIDQIKIDQDQKNYIRDQVNKIWDKYDVDYSGVLDKIESANFLNEILTA